MTTMIGVTYVTRALRSGVAAAAILAVLASCAQVKEVGGGLRNSLDNAFGNYIDESDVCVAQRREMADSGSLFDQDTMRLFAAAVIVGVVTGAITGDTTTGVAAAALTFGAGYVNKLIEEGKSGAEVTNTVSGDVRAANGKIDKVTAAFRDVDKCRRGEADVVRSDLRDGRITLAAAQTRMAEIKRKRDEDVAKFKEIAENISESTASYAVAYNEIAADNGRRGFEISPDGGVKRSSSRAKKAATEPGSLSGAGGANVDKLQRDCLTNVKKRDECFELIADAESEDAAFTI